jgi:hypothetical protein
VSDEPFEPPESDPIPTGRSRYEDFELPVPGEVPRSRTRTPTLVMAAVVLGVSGVLPVLTVVAFHLDGAAATALLVLGAAELVACVLVARLHPAGRILGLILGGVGVVLGLATARTSPANGLVTMGLNGFVIYALASSGAAFRRG